MKRIVAVFCLVLSAVAVLAQDNVLIEARFIEYPASQSFTKKDLTERSFEKRAGLDTLSAPKLMVTSGKPAVIMVADERKVPDAENGGQRTINSGVEMKVLPTVEGGKVKYHAAVTIRQPEDAPKSKEFTVSEFSTRECFLEGAATAGEPVLINCTGIHKEKKLAILLTFSTEPKR
jgi:hypothetical protein